MHVLSIGSSVIDLFLSVDKDHFKSIDEKVTLALGDKIPSEIKKSAIGGNGANVAVGLTKLEIPTTFYTYLGKDYFSRQVEEGLTSEGVELKVERHENAPSPLHVILDFPTDRIIFSNYSRNPHGFELEDKSFDYIFLTSIPEDWSKAYEKILEYKKNNNIPLAFSPGTRQIEEKNDLVLEVLKNSTMYFSNREEAEHVTGFKAEDENSESFKKLLKEVKKLGPEIVSITDGARGAYAIDKDNNAFHVPPAPSDGEEKTGAGDAYATGFLAATLHGEDIKTAMIWGTENSGGTMQEIGAQNGLLTKKGIDEKLKSDNLEVVSI